MPSAPRVVQVTNVAPATTREQLKTLFGYLGRIDDLVIYPTAESSTTTSKVCYVKFAYADDVDIALHLTNTVFIDRALNVVRVPDGRIPDEKTGMSSSYQNLASSEGSKGDEVERTVYVANLDAAVPPETLMQFFGLNAGEVKYARMAGDESLPIRAAYIEFSEKASVSRALAQTGQMLGSRPVTVVLSNTAIVKSFCGLEGASKNEIEEALRKVNEAQPLISAAVDSDGSRRKRSRSKSRSRSQRSRSRSHRSRSRKHSRSRSRRRSRSRSPKQSKSKDHRRHKSRSKSPKSGRSHRSRSRSKGRKTRGDSDKGGYSPAHSERDGYGSSKRSSKDDKSQESSKRRSRSSRSKSPVPYTRKDKDRHRGSSDYDGKREQEVGSSREGKHDKKSGDKRGHGDRKASSKHHRYEEQVKKSKKATKHKTDSDEERDDEVDEEQERSAAEESNDERYAESAESDQQARSRSSSPGQMRSRSGSSEAAQANLSRMDMDVESD